MLTDPRPRPRMHLSSVSVIDLLEPIGSARPQQLRVRRRSEIASHNLYLTTPQEMCHACRICGNATSRPTEESLPSTSVTHLIAAVVGFADRYWPGWSSLTAAVSAFAVCALAG